MWSNNENDNEIDDDIDIKSDNISNPESVSDNLSDNHDRTESDYDNDNDIRNENININSNETEKSTQILPDRNLAKRHLRVNKSRYDRIKEFVINGGKPFKTVLMKEFDDLTKDDIVKYLTKMEKDGIIVKHGNRYAMKNKNNNTKPIKRKQKRYIIYIPQLYFKTIIYIIIEIQLNH